MRFRSFCKVLSLTLTSTAFAFTALTANAVPVTRCGKPNADIKVCVTSWALPGGESGTNLSVSYSSPAKSQASTATPGAFWVYGQGPFPGQTLGVKMLPAFGKFTAPAELHYSNGKNYMRVPGTEIFELAVE